MQIELGERLLAGERPIAADAAAYEQGGLPDRRPEELMAVGREHIATALRRAPDSAYVKELAERYGIARR